MIEFNTRDSAIFFIFIFFLICFPTAKKNIEYNTCHNTCIASFDKKESCFLFCWQSHYENNKKLTEVEQLENSIKIQNHEITEDKK